MKSKKQSVDLTGFQLKNKKVLEKDTERKSVVKPAKSNNPKGAPKKDAADKLSKKITISFLEDEDKKIRAKAKESGMGPGPYLRMEMIKNGWL